jgi:hypothetical protein
MFQLELLVFRCVFIRAQTLKCAGRRGADYFLLIGAAAIFLGISIIAGIVYTYADIRCAQADSFLGIHDFAADL